MEIGHTWLDKTGYLRHSIGHGEDQHVHKTIVENVLGRPLENRESVHHLNGIKTDNRPENLVICPDDAYHARLHARTDSLDDGFHPDLFAYCSDCKAYHTKESFPKSINRWNGVHNICKVRQNARRSGNIKHLERRRELRRIRREQDDRIS